MYYAILKQQHEILKARFYNRADRDQFVKDTGAEPVRSRKIDFVPGADGNATYGHRDARGNWVRV